MRGSTRREWLGLCAAAGASGILVKRASAAERPAVSAVDHLLFGVADLDRGVARIEQTTGVRAIAGGSHPGVGTRNALVSLGSRRYLEIIAPDPAQTEFAFRIDVRKLAEPRLITWAAATADLEGVAKSARNAGLEVFGPQPGRRSRPDGKVLRWRTVAVKSDLAADGVDPIPFFIEWAADSRHPSQDSPGGLELLGFDIIHPRSSDVRNLLGRLGIESTVRTGEKAIIAATLRTPRGTLRLS
jgi:hypothetical protein